MIKRPVRGQSLVEFAIVFPLFLMMVFGMMEGGWLLFAHHQIGNAAREGARYAIARGSEGDTAVTLAGIQSHVVDTVAGIDTATIEIDATWSGSDPGDSITVNVDYAHQPLTGMIFGRGTLSLSASSTMRFHY